VPYTINISIFTDIFEKISETVKKEKLLANQDTIQVLIIAVMWFKKCHDCTVIVWRFACTGSVGAI